MEFPNFRVGRVVVHEVFARNEAGRVDPALSDDLLALDKEAKDEFQKRVTEALSAENQSIHMVIVERGEGSFLRTGVSLLSEPDASFAGASCVLAEKLTSSQQSRRLPGGMLIVFDGTIGADNRRVLGAIKAETQGAFTKTIKDGAATIEFLREVFLTPAVRLYKVGLIVQVPDHDLSDFENGWEAHVFDANVRQKDPHAAANYFYQTFLGCDLPRDGAIETLKFYEASKEFITDSSLDPETKYEKIDSLRVFVRDEQDATFTVDQFADRFLPEELRDDYCSFLERKKVPRQAIIRDQSLVRPKLRKRSMKFGNDIRLVGSDAVLRERVKLSPVEVTLANGSKVMGTNIQIAEPYIGEA